MKQAVPSRLQAPTPPFSTKSQSLVREKRRVLGNAFDASKRMQSNTEKKGPFGASVPLPVRFWSEPRARQSLHETLWGSCLASLLAQIWTPIVDGVAFLDHKVKCRPLHWTLLWHSISSSCELPCDVPAFNFRGASSFRSSRFCAPIEFDLLPVLLLCGYESGPSIPGSVEVLIGSCKTQASYCILPPPCGVLGLFIARATTKNSSRTSRTRLKNRDV